MRDFYEEQLNELHTQMIAMGGLCEKAISNATKALTDGDLQLAEEIMKNDAIINRQERDIESLCMKLILHQQPVAGDLRRVSAALKMVTDMERIGDQAADIAEITRHIGSTQLPARSHIGEMARAAVKMVTDSVESFVKKDLNMARGVIQYDDVVDQLFNDVKAELTALIRDDSDSAELALDLLMVAKYLERIGDHAVNVGEWVAFSITGVHESGD